MTELLRRLLLAVSALCTESYTMGTRTFMITGATDGIGKHTAERLASDRNAVIIHGRKSRSHPIVTSIIQDLESRGAANVCYLQADFNDAKQVELMADAAVDVLRDWQQQKAPKRDMSQIPALDVLINNAGVFDPKPRHSLQGYDSTIAVNVMAPFVLTRKLLPCLAHGDEARIITTSSISHSWQLPDVDRLFSRKLSDTAGEESSEPDNQPLSYSAHSFYSHSKLCDMMFTSQLAKILSNYEVPTSIENKINDSQRNLLRKLKRIQCLTMDPGTVNTKMLLAGWGACGINVKTANNTYELATSSDYVYGKVENGSYHFGGGGSRDSRDKKKLNEFWHKLATCTGYDYEDLSDCF
eukprot:CCRYP_009241-RA/>CCRYP_009241-RA protein AED:0.16 eAED:0.13 QI:0/-1/0/1/-1/1/1/0/354